MKFTPALVAGMIGTGLVIGAGACYIYADHSALRVQIRSLLRRVLPILKEHQIQHFLLFGTLLGYFREGDVIFGDTDGDIGVIESDKNLVLQARSDFGKVNVRIKNCGPHLLRLVDRSKSYVYVDLYLMDEGTDGILGRRLWSDKDMAVVIPKNLIFPTRSTKFLGIDTMIPQKPEELLTYIYGDGWRVPKRHNKGRHSGYTAEQLFGTFCIFRLGLMQLFWGK